jgi:hypothetical protein
MPVSGEDLARLEALARAIIDQVRALRGELELEEQGLASGVGPLPRLTRLK